MWADTNKGHVPKPNQYLKKTIQPVHIHVHHHHHQQQQQQVTPRTPRLTTHPQYYVIGRPLYPSSQTFEPSYLHREEDPFQCFPQGYMLAFELTIPHSLR